MIEKQIKKPKFSHNPKRVKFWYNNQPLKEWCYENNIKYSIVTWYIRTFNLSIDDAVKLVLARRNGGVYGNRLQVGCEILPRICSRLGLEESQVIHLHKVKHLQLRVAIEFARRMKCIGKSFKKKCSELGLNYFRVMKFAINENISADEAIDIYPKSEQYKRDTYYLIHFEGLTLRHFALKYHLHYITLRELVKYHGYRRLSNEFINRYNKNILRRRAKDELFNYGEISSSLLQRT